MQLTSAINIESFKSLYEQEKKEKELLKAEVMKLQLQLHKLTQIVFGSRANASFQTLPSSHLVLTQKRLHLPAI